MEKSRNDLWKISLQTLKNGNIKYLQAQKSDGDISPEIRKNTFQIHASYPNTFFP